MNSLYVSFNGFYRQELLERWLHEEDGYEALNECVGYVSGNAYEGDNFNKIIEHAENWKDMFLCCECGKIFNDEDFMVFYENDIDGFAKCLNCCGESENV